MTVPAAKICVVCHKDVSNAKRVKDPVGHYYCASCHEAALRQHAPANSAAKPADSSARKTPIVKPAPASVATAPSKPAADDDDLLPLVPVTTKPLPRAAPAASSSTPAKLPEFCPNCGAKVLAGRRLCIKCNRDVTQLDKIAALRAQADAGPSAEEKVANVFGVVMRIGLVIFCLAVAAFVFYGVYLRIKPVDTFEDYPTTREQAVRDFLKNINEGSDKSFEKAFYLISFRERTTNNTSEDVKYKLQFKQMRDDFIKKYGDDWNSRYQLENLGPDDNYADDEVDFSLKLGDDKYKVATQVQIAVDVASANMIRPMKVKPVYPENGKNHFGILDFEGYKPNPRRTMVERLGINGRQRPDDL